MTLVRYLGPVRAWIGAIGWRTADGMRLAGREVRGDVAPARYRVDVPGGRADCDSWRMAAGVLADALQPVDASAAREVRAATADPGGLTCAVDGNEYRLTVV